jgi:hypothetical protein
VGRPWGRQPGCGGHAASAAAGGPLAGAWAAAAAAGPVISPVQWIQILQPVNTSPGLQIYINLTKT